MVKEQDEDLESRFCGGLVIVIPTEKFPSFNSGGEITLFVPNRWEVRRGDQIEYEFGYISGIAKIVEFWEDPYCGKRLCIRKVD